MRGTLTIWWQELTKLRVVLNSAEDSAASLDIGLASHHATVQTQPMRAAKLPGCIAVDEVFGQDYRRLMVGRSSDPSSVGCVSETPAVKSFTSQVHFYRKPHSRPGVDEG